MPEAIYQEALEAYVNPHPPARAGTDGDDPVGRSFHEFAVVPLGAGLINQSYKITSQYSGDSFLLQKINTHVFTEPENVQNNYELIWKYISANSVDFYMPEPKYFPDNQTLFRDSKNNYWRIFEFIGNSYTPSTFKVKQAKDAAIIFGEFASCMDEFDAEQLHIVIPGFHDLSLRYKQFELSLRTDNSRRLIKTALLADELKKRERYANFYDVIIESEEFPRRVMHHDAKIANVLYDKDDDEVLCPVDFDTTMPGYFFSDLGDMIRTMTCPVDENSVDFEKITVRKKFYEAIIEGYLKSMNDHLTASEKKYIHYAGLLMTYMQALRFLSDYLNGDVYYKVDYKEQNFDRAKNQLTLLEKLEKFIKVNYTML